jgi:hypothetical protein
MEIAGEPAMATKAKAKKAKASGRVSPGRKKVDRCRPLREHVRELQQEIRNVRAQLSDRDIPPDTRRKLQQLLNRLVAQLPRALTLLRQCEAIPNV